MKKTKLFVFMAALLINWGITTAQVQTGVFKTSSGNTDFHHFTRNHATGAAVFVNQESSAGPILRLSSGIATAGSNVKFSFENNGNLGIGTITPGEKLSLYTAGNTKVVTQYGNGTGSGFSVGMNTEGNGSVWHTSTTKTISFGTSNLERMRINANGTVDFLSTVQSKGYRTMPDNTNYHQFVSNNTSNAAVYINQAAASGAILRLSSGIATANQNVKFSFENNGNLGIGTTAPAEKLSLYTAGNTKVVTQYGNGTGSGFSVGMNTEGNGSIWHTSTTKTITFGTSNKERMRINAGGAIDFLGAIQSVSGGYKIDTTGIFQSKGYRTIANNVNYHQFVSNNTSNAAVYINQAAASGAILRLSSGIATANQNVKFTFENNGNLGIGTTAPAEKLSLYTAGSTKVVTQYGNGTGSGYSVGMNTDGTGMVWHTANKTITFGTNNAERMRINSGGTVDFLSTTQSKGYRTMPDNTNYHHFVSNITSNAAVYINQAAASGAILRLSSGIATANQNVKFTFENNGNLGVGTTTPAEKLSLYTAGNTKVVTQYGNGTGSGFSVGMSTEGNGSIWHTAAKVISFGTSNAERMRIHSNGNIGIGTASPDYKLDVVGNVRAHSVQISTAKTADFVFEKDYPLMSLSEVESFITANKHLPEVAPASEMIEKGIDMAEMQIKLLQKVEELTLYAIQQQKEIEELKLKTKN